MQQRDQRDPLRLGAALLVEAHAARDEGATVTLSQVYDLKRDLLDASPDYSHNPTPIEKYGRPQDKHRDGVQLV